jgi:hypothetical protein
MFYGIDLGVTATGVACYGETPRVIVPSKYLDLDILRIRYICNRLDIAQHSLVVIEEPQARLGASRINLGLFWCIRDYLLTKECLVFSVSPRTVKKFATNDGNADKAKMNAAAGIDKIIVNKKQYTSGAMFNKYLTHAVDAYYMMLIGRTLECQETPMLSVAAKARLI